MENWDIIKLSRINFTKKHDQTILIVNNLINNKLNEPEYAELRQEVEFDESQQLLDDYRISADGEGGVKNTTKQVLDIAKEDLSKDFVNFDFEKTFLYISIIMV